MFPTRPEDFEDGRSYFGSAKNQQTDGNPNRYDRNLGKQCGIT